MAVSVMDPRVPGAFQQEAGNNRAEIHVHGLSTTQGLAICALAGISLGIGIMSIVNTNARFDALTDRTEAAEKQALVAKLRTEGFTRALIAKGIDPYPHLEGEDP